MAKSDNNSVSRVEFPHICVFDSSAGSGKTHQLTLHYLRLLLSSDRRSQHGIRNILAITFTNAAVNEMRSRIIEWMKNIVLAGAGDPTRYILEPLDFDGRKYSMIDLPEGAVRDRILPLLEDSILRHFDDFKITTIDSFIAMLLKAQSLKLGIPPDFEITVDVDPFLSSVMDGILQDILTDGETRRTFLEFLDQYEFLVPADKMQWSPREFIEEKIRTIWDWFLSNRADIDRFVNEPHSAAAFGAERSAKFDGLRGLFDRFSGGIRISLGQGLRLHKNFLNFLDAGVNTTDDLFGFFSRKGPEESVLKDSIPFPAELGNQWRELRRLASDYLRGFSAFYFTSLSGLFGLFIRRLKERISTGRKTILMPQLSYMVSEIIRGVEEKGDYINELFLYLHGRFFHYLIDEFQDTNRVQWENMSFLVEENLSRGGSLFVVGDNKQLIYGWRGASLGLMNGFREPFGHIEFYRESLTVNRRSVERIVEFNNAVFDPGNLASSCSGENERLRTLIGEFYAGSRQDVMPSKKGEGRIEALLVESGDTRDETIRKVREAFSGLVDGLLKRRKSGDLCVLCRSNEQAGQAVEWLLALGCPVEAEITVDIRNNSLIREFLSLIDFFNKPAVDFNLMNFLTGALFAGYSARTGIGPGMTEWCGTALLKGRDPLYKIFRENHEDLWDRMFEGFFRSIGYSSMYEFSMRLMKEWKVFELFPEFGPYFLKFLEVVHVLEKEKGSNISGLSEYFESASRDDIFLLDTAEGANAVRVKTIHKAKGLSFPVVIMPFAGYRKERPGNMYFDRADDGSADLYYINSDFKIVEGLSEIYDETNARTSLEEINNLYVAFTRPKEELYLFLPSSKGLKNLFKAAIFANPALSAFLDESKTRIVVGDIPQAGKITAEKPDKAVFRDLSPGVGWMELLRRSISGEGPLAGPEGFLKAGFAEERGVMIHEILSNLAAYSETGLAERIDEAAKRRGLDAQSPAVTDAARLLDAAFRDPAFRAFYETSGEDKILNEREIVDARGRLKRVDRLVVRKDRVDLLDLKTGAEYREDHEAQMREYSGLVSSLYPGKPVKCWLYYLDQLELKSCEV